MKRLVTFLFLVSACDAPAPSDAGLDAPPSDAPAAATDETFEVIDERMVTVLDVPRRVELIRGTRTDGVHTYLLYVHAQVEPAPLVILNQPYAGIDWTGEAVDARWAALGPGLHADVDAPAYDGDDLTTYGPQTVQQAVEDGAVWLLNGAAIVQVYARFYAGGSLLDDAEDAAMGYAFAASRPSELALDRIGSFGGSWGGMMAIFGAALADDAHPRSIAAMAPPTDFVDLYEHTDVELPTRFPVPAQVEAFFSPYWRRATPAIGSPPSRSDPRAIAFTPEGICAALSSDVLVPHDDWDLLIPVRQTEALRAACGDKIEPLYWRRGALDYARLPLDHGPFNAEPVYPSLTTFTTLHLLHALLPETGPILTLGHHAALEAFVRLVVDARAGGEDIAWALDPLRQIADARVSLYDPSTMVFTPGAEVLASAINRVFSTSFDAASLRTQLETGLP